MIDYTLAKELKEAGFPQITFDALKPYMGICFDPQGNSYWSLKKMTPEWTYAPTLEELIEACEPSFKGVAKIEEGAWQAWCTADIPDKLKVRSTAIEAVAALWLALQGNKQVV